MQNVGTCRTPRCLPSRHTVAGPAARLFICLLPPRRSPACRSGTWCSFSTTARAMAASRISPTSTLTRAWASSAWLRSYRQAPTERRDSWIRQPRSHRWHETCGQNLSVGLPTDSRGITLLSSVQSSCWHIVGASLKSRPRVFGVACNKSFSVLLTTVVSDRRIPF